MNFTNTVSGFHSVIKYLTTLFLPNSTLLFSYLKVIFFFNPLKTQVLLLAAVFFDNFFWFSLLPLQIIHLCKAQKAETDGSEAKNTCCSGKGPTLGPWHPCSRPETLALSVGRDRRIAGPRMPLMWELQRQFSSQEHLLFSQRFSAPTQQATQNHL